MTHNLIGASKLFVTIFNTVALQVQGNSTGFSSLPHTVHTAIIPAVSAHRIQRYCFTTSSPLRLCRSAHSSCPRHDTSNSTPSWKQRGTHYDSMMAARRALTTFSTILGSSPSFSPPAARVPAVLPQLLRPYPRLPRTLQPTQAAAAARRYAHSIPKPPGKGGQTKSRKQSQPHYELTFTCVPCSERSTHTISKQGYHHGSVLITCPSCRNRHIISDHLNIFGDRKITIEDLMKERGQLVKRGTLGEDGDIEFWEDGTQTQRANRDTASDDPALEDADNASSGQDVQPTLPPSTASGPLTGGAPRPKLPTASPAHSTPSSSRREYHSDATDDSMTPQRTSRFTGIRKEYGLSPQHRAELNDLRAALKDMEKPGRMHSSSQQPTSNTFRRITATKQYGSSWKGQLENGQRDLPTTELNGSQPLKPFSYKPKAKQTAPNGPFAAKKGMPIHGPMKTTALNDRVQPHNKKQPAQTEKA
jgi:mitochondrial protein import protein ZIM17